MNAVLIMNRILYSIFCLFFFFCLFFTVPLTRAEEEEPTLYLEFFWVSDSAPREALFISPPRNIPLVIVRAFSREEKLESLVAARGTLIQNTENSEELFIACSEPRTVWGNADPEKVVPQNFLFTGKEYGAVDLGGVLTTCLVKPVLPANKEEVIKKYLPPKKN